MAWTSHIAKTSRACGFALSKLNPLQDLLSVKNRILEINSLVFSKLFYASVVWMKPSDSSVVDSLIKRCVRFIFKRLKYDSISSSVCECKYLYTKFKTRYDNLKLALNVSNNKCPNYFRNYLTSEKTEGIVTRRVKYHEPNLQYLNIGKRSFKYSGSKELTQLSPSDLSSLSIKQIRTKVFSSLLDAQLKEFCTPPTDSHDFCDLSCIDDVINSLLTSS